MKYGNSTSQGHKFNQIPQANIQRSTFDRSHGLKTTIGTAGRLYPVLVDEILPGDTFNMRAHIFARQATPFQPILDNLVLTSFSFFCPTRLVWDNFNAFMGEELNPGDTTDYTVPQVVMEAVETAKAGQWFDQAGIPPDAGEKSVNALPSRCSNLIWNEWFRDENNQDLKVVDKDDGPDTVGDYDSLRWRNKAHDYFSGALPFTQKTPAHLDAPLIIAGQAPVTGQGALIPSFTSGGAGTTVFGLQHLNDPGNSIRGDQSTDDAGTLRWSDTALEVDFDALADTGVNSINELRMAFQMQKLFERDARGGTRYTEIIRSHFGVSTPDARLQRPEFLGGGKQIIRTTAVPVSSDAASGIVGELGAYATSQGSNHSWSKSFTEHGYVITYICVDASLTYQRGVERMWTRKTKHDFMWPALVGIGEQAIRNDEIHATGVGDEILLTGDAGVFGYTPRYEEYRNKSSRTASLMRSSAAGSLDVWHLAQDFEDTLPVLGDIFLRSFPPMDRVSAITTEDDFIVDIQFEYKCTRPLPTFGVPGLIDHF